MFDGQRKKAYCVQDSHFSFSIVLEAGHETICLSVLECNLVTAETTRNMQRTCNAKPMPLMAYPSTNAGNGKAADSMAYAITCSTDPGKQHSKHVYACFLVGSIETYRGR